MSIRMSGTPCSNSPKVVPYGHQWLDNDDVDAVVGVLASDWLTQGPKVIEFEDSLCKYTGAKYAVAVSSGTAALHIASLAAGISKGGEAITSPITFIASANCAVYCGGSPVFADIDPDTINISPGEIGKKITKYTKAIIPVHFAGQPAAMEKIWKIANANGLAVIEDACHALGAKYRAGSNWIRVGSCAHSDMTVFSFHPVKHITTGEGGAVTTNNGKLYEKLLALRNHGIYKGKDMARRGPWYYEMRELGFNYRITDFQCALGVSQLKRIETFIARRRDIAARYDEAFSGMAGVKSIRESRGCFSSYHLYVIKIDFDALGVGRAAVMAMLKERGIQTQVHYIPVHTQPFYIKSFGTGWGQCPAAEDYYQKCLSIPLYPAMSDKDVRKVISAIKGEFGRSAGGIK